MVSKRAVITFLEDHEVDPGFGVSAPGYPSQGLPGGGGHPSQGLPGFPTYPSQGLPGGGHISLLPVFPFDPTRPDNSLPGSGGSPDNTLPGAGQPDQGLPRPGKKYVVKWLACHGLILVPDNSLPDTAEPK